jgi:DNA-binding NarL/FixJ family response regulator
MSIRVLLAGDHRILQDGLRCLLACHGGFEIVGDAESGDSIVALCRDLRPDIVLLEAGMEGCAGVEIAGRIHGELPQIRIIAHSAPVGRRLLAGMLRAGASGYLDRNSGSDHLLKALESIAAGRPYLGGIAPGNLIDELNAHPAAPAHEERPGRTHPRNLTAREIEVLRLLATGKRVKEIARILHISVKTVESHRQNMMDKLEIHNAIELARYALREGLASV